MAHDFRRERKPTGSNDQPPSEVVEQSFVPSRPFAMPDSYWAHYGIRLKRDPDTSALSRIAPHAYWWHYGIGEISRSPGSAAPVQRRSEHGTEEDPRLVQEAAKRGLQGAARALPYLDQIQRAFGDHDVTGIRAYVGGPAAAASRAMGALAYASGDAVAFREAPDLHTAAHEAAHVVQQRSGVRLRGGVGEAGDAYERHADEVADRVVKGQSVAGLFDAGHGARAPAHHAAVQRLDDSNGNTEILDRINSLIRRPVAAADANEVMTTLGAVSEDRLRIIVNDLVRNGRMTDFLTNLANPVAAGHAAVMTRITALRNERAHPTAGTTATTAAQDTRIQSILNRGMNVNAGGQVVAFVDNVAGRTFSQDVQETLEREVTAMTARARTRDTLPRHGWPRYEQIAQEAKQRTDSVYGHYATGAAPTHGGAHPNLFDVRDQTYSGRDLREFANYLVTGHNPINPIYPGQRITAVHNADLGRAAEAGILATAIRAWIATGTNRDRLLLIRRNWSGVQQGGNIFLQRWDMGNAPDNRRQFWSTFQTMIHEYLHKVTHTHYSDKARALGRAREQVYTEGGTSYFDRNVWNALNPQEISANAQLRETVEGAPYPYDASVIPAWHGYAQVTQFEDIVAEVGEENARAAYFRGLTDRIGLGP